MDHQQLGYGGQQPPSWALQPPTYQQGVYQALEQQHELDQQQPAAVRQWQRPPQMPCEMKHHETELAQMAPPPEAHQLRHPPQRALTSEAAGPQPQASFHMSQQGVGHQAPQQPQQVPMAPQEPGRDAAGSCPHISI